MKYMAAGQPRAIMCTAAKMSNTVKYNNLVAKKQSRVAIQSLGDGDGAGISEPEPDLVQIPGKRQTSKNFLKNPGELVCCTCLQVFRAPDW